MARFAAYAYENLGAATPASPTGVAYAYERVIDKRATSATAYVYLNVGISQEPPPRAAVEYLYLNVGIASLAPEGDVVEYIYLHVDETAVAAPHLWKIEPATGGPGTHVTVYGTGLLPTTGQAVAFYGTQPGWEEGDEIAASREIDQIEAPHTVPASPEAYGPNRSIPAEGDPNVEHQRMVVEIPIPARTNHIRVGVKEPEG